MQGIIAVTEIILYYSSVTILNNKPLKAYLYHHIFVAGTFDGLHAGHRSILSEAFRAGEKVSIGLTSDEFVQQYKRKTQNSKLKTTSQNSHLTQLLHSYQHRLRALEVFLRDQGYFHRTTIIPISDPHEPAASMRDLTALIVTKENRTTGERINALRYALGVSPLSLMEVPIVPAQDGKPISSTRLRSGEIDGDGRLVMPEALRTALGKPLGNILRGKAIVASIRSHEHDCVLTVGDLSTKTVLEAGVMPRLAVIDGQVGRKPFPDTLTMIQLQKVKPFRFKTVKSGPGFISSEAMKTIEHFFASYVLRPTSYVLLIDGEEDLLVLPVIQHAPLGSILYYGQPARNATHNVAGGPGEGLVEVEVTSVIKKQVVAIMKQFLS